jgi:AraC family transcriptional activator of tynA and feaB
MQTSPVERVFVGRDAWQAGMHEHLLPLHCEVAEPGSFKCSTVITRLRGNSVAELDVDASTLRNRPARNDESSAESVKVMWQLAGRSHIRQGPNGATLEAGAWTLCDPSREFDISFEQGARCLLMLVPRSQCGGWLLPLDSLSALALPAGGPAHVALAMLTSILRDISHLDEESERTLHESVVALIDRALSAEMKARGMSLQSHRSLRLSRVQAYMLERLADHSLTIDRVAAVFGVSRRSLYNAFAPIGVTPHAFIQNARLDRACALLGHPSWRNAPMAQIATHCGFTDPAHFSRAFHARHGTVPTAWRRTSITHDAQPAAANGR